MAQELSEQKSLHSNLKHGDILSQREFTQLLLEQEGIMEIDLYSMAYMTPREEDNSVAKIHAHLLKLADQGTIVRVGVDHNYAHLIAPHSDFPNILAPFVMDRRDLRKEQMKQASLYGDLAEHPNITLIFQGENEQRVLPISRFDHRKILRVRGSQVQDFAVIYGFNMDDTIDHDIDSGIYLTNPQALAWIDEQLDKERQVLPEKIDLTGLTLITRELGKNGNLLADTEIREVIQSANKSLIFCSQFIPDGEVLSELVNAAKRGVDVTIISNNPSLKRQPLFALTAEANIRKLLRLSRTNPNIHFYVPNAPEHFIHLKALIADIEEPEQAQAITGTDNLCNNICRRLGTREILIRLSSYELVNNLYTYLQQHLSKAIQQIA